MNESISLVVGPEAIAGYKRLPYKQWYALAEFIDNTTQAYFDNKSTLDPILESENEPLTITIVTDNNSIAHTDINAVECKWWVDDVVVNADNLLLATFVD